MALVYQRWWGAVKRPWGFEVRVDYQNDATGEVYTEELLFPAKPTAATLTAAIAARRLELVARLIEAAKQTIRDRRRRRIEAIDALLDLDPDDTPTLAAAIDAIRDRLTAYRDALEAAQ